MIKAPLFWHRERARALPQAPLVTLLTLIGSFTLYARTAAPSVLSGDGGEFQFAAYLLGVAHPTGYPLYVLLGKLMTLVPVGDIAYRVTLTSALMGAGTVAVLALLVLRVTRCMLAALIAAIALTVAPGMWHLSTIAEVYTLNTLFLSLLALTLWHAYHAGTVNAPEQSDASGRRPRPNRRWLYAAAFITGLGISNHGSFAFTGAPLLLVFGLLALVRVWIAGERSALQPLPWLILAGALGLTPWLFVYVRYAQWGPFDGLDHGLPRAYFWGAPTTWAEALTHVVGGTMRQTVFVWPGLRTLFNAALALWERLQFEFGPSGVSLGVIGCYHLLRHPLWLWLGSVWVAAITALYFASLGAAVRDAMDFTLPMLLPYALWVGIGARALASAVDRLLAEATRRPGDETTRRPGNEATRRPGDQATRRPGDQVTRRRRAYGLALLGLMLVLTLGWGYDRLPYGNKAHLWLFREFGMGVLAHLEPDAVVLTRWEQGTIVQYLRLVEGQRPDVQVDIVEREDEPWRDRVRRRYPDRTVYIIGNAADAADLGATYVWGTDYATLFRLQR